MADDVVVALDVGGTGIKCALVDGTATVRHTERHATGRERGPDAVVATILRVAEGRAAATGHRRGRTGDRRRAGRRGGVVGEPGLPRRTAA